MKVIRSTYPESEKVNGHCVKKGLNTQDVLTPSEFNKIKLKFRKCLFTGIPQIVTYTINSTPILGLMRRCDHGNNVIVHRVEETNTKYRQQNIDFLKRAAHRFNDLKKLLSAI